MLEFIYGMGIFLIDLAFWFFGMTIFLGLSFLVIAFMWHVWKELKEEEKDG